jgi:hypothetical protein
MNIQDFFAGSASPAFLGATGFLLVIVALWTLVWKGMALWKAAQEKSKVWFIVLLVVNTVGILDILYIYVFSKKSAKPVVEAPTQI